jgi:hypothetical protein
MKEREEKIQNIIDELCSYEGFTDWWFDVEDEEMESIIVDLSELIK